MSNRDFGDTFNTFRSGPFQILQDVATGTWVFRHPIPTCKEGLETFSEELDKWLDWYKALVVRAETAEKLRNEWQTEANRLQDENERLRERCRELANAVVSSSNEQGQQAKGNVDSEAEGHSEDSQQQDDDEEVE